MVFDAKPTPERAAAAAKLDFRDLGFDFYLILLRLYNRIRNTRKPWDF